MSRFEGSSLIGSEALPFEAFSLPTGPVKQDEAFQWQLTDKIDVEEKINGYVYAIPKGHSTLEAFRNYEAALQNLGFEKLFSCNSEATCGAPDTLAQRIYDGSHVMQDGGLRSAQAIIYGSEIHYLAAKRSRDGADSYASLLVARESSMSGADQDTLSAVLHIIEPKPIGQSLVMVDAAKMDSDIGASGHVTEIHAGPAEHLTDVAATVMTRFKTNSVSSMKRHISSSARSGRVSATFSTISWRCRSRSFTKARRFSQSMTDRACRSLVSRLPISAATASAPTSALSSSRNRRLTPASPMPSSAGFRPVSWHRALRGWRG